MGTDGGVDESVVQPAADEGEVPSSAAGSSLGDEAEAGSGLVVMFHPYLRNGVGIQAREADLQAPPPLRPSLSAGIAPLRPP
jgi:hypothetical protein